MYEIDIVNVVGGGDLGIEFKLEAIQRTIQIDSEYEPEQYPGLRFKLPETGVTVMLFRTGQYHLTGGKSIDDLHDTKDHLVSMLGKVRPDLDEKKVTCEVRNLVCVTDIGRELDLPMLSVGLGLDSTEYEPEQFPGIVYSAPEFQGTFIIFRSGKMILTGCNNKSSLTNSFSLMSSKMRKLFQSADDSDHHEH